MVDKQNFNEEEQRFINETFRITLPYFVDSPLDRDNQEDMLKALRYREKHIGYIGVKGHRIIQSIYDKLGYWKDGITTKTEKEREQKIKTIEKEVNFKKEKAQMIDAINKQIQALQNLKAEIESEDEKVAKQATKIKNKLAEKEKMLIENERLKIREELLKKASAKLNQMTVAQLREAAKKKGIKKIATMRKNELVKEIAKAEIKED
ncbi:MAG: Rho termination factor N-terminal domain-containing protein [Candidatus Helarchaeota archaeon]